MLKKIISLLSILLICILIFESTGLDLLIQDTFYNFKSQHWILDKQAPIPRFIFYDGIKKAFILFVIGLLISLLFFRHKSLIIKYKKGVIIVLLSCITIPLFIGFLKATTHIPCPKNIRRYGGHHLYTTLLKRPTIQNKTMKCYPAGHASGGFALMSLYFLFFSKRKKRLALISAITLGWIIGFYKMIIGDHFFSHTLVTMIIAWLIILFIVKFVDRVISRQS